VAVLRSGGKADGGSWGCPMVEDALPTYIYVKVDGRARIPTL
jgi:hypothetical protein